MGALLTGRVCTTFCVLQVTLPRVCDKNEDLKSSAGKGKGTGVLLRFCCRSVG